MLAQVDTQEAAGGDTPTHLLLLVTHINTCITYLYTINITFSCLPLRRDIKITIIPLFSCYPTSVFLCKRALVQTCSKASFYACEYRKEDVIP